MVIYNKNSQAQTLDLNRFNSVLADNSSAISILTGNKLKLDQSFAQPHAGIMLLELKTNNRYSIATPKRTQSMLNTAAKP